MNASPRKARRASSVAIAALASLALLAGACAGGGDTAADGGDTAAGGDAPADGGSTAEPATIRFMFASDNPIQYYPVFLAQELGYYEEENLTVEIESVGGSSAAIQQLVAGNADIAMPSPPSYMNAASRGEDLYFFYQMHYTNVFDLIAPEGGPVSSPADLKGLTVGVSELAGGEVPFVRVIMSDAGLNEGTDFEIIPIGEGGALTLNALQSGEVQAYSSSIYDIASLKAAGQPVVSIMPTEYRNYPANGFVSTGALIEEREDEFVRFLRAVNKAVVFGRTNPDAVLDILVPTRPDLYDDPVIVAAFWEATLGMMTPPAEVANEAIGLHYRPGWQGMYEFLRSAPEDQGGLPADIDLDSGLMTRLIELSQDFDVAAIEEQARNYAG
jgi:NitT/TauT family transport system substrate-binding protein